MYEGGRYERKARCRDGVHPPRTHYPNPSNPCHKEVYTASATEQGGRITKRPIHAATKDATLHPPRKKTKEPHANKLDNYFAHKATGTSPQEIEALDIPDVATDVRSTYFHLHKKRHTYAEDKNFHIVKDALSELRGYVNQKRLHKMTTDPPKTPKTIRQYFKESSQQLLSTSRHLLLKRLVPRNEKLHVTMSFTHICGGHTM